MTENPSVHHSFVYHLLKEDTEHIRPYYSTIYGKEIYPVAICEFKNKGYYNFSNKSKYIMIR